MTAPTVCPCCGTRNLWHHPGEPFAFSCGECVREWRDEAELLAAAAELDREAWGRLHSFHRLILREPESERALRRVLRPLLEAGIEAEVALEVVHAVNLRRRRPAPPADVDQLAVDVAREVGAARRRKGAA